MPRFKITLEFAGTRYSGWQKQKNARTVQGALEHAIAEATGESRFECMGSGRTDAGVHALMQVAHLDIRATPPPEALRRRLNELLPSDIQVLAVERAHARFHARHHAVRRVYLYQVSRRRTAFAKPYVWWVKEPLQIDRMRAAAAVFEGMHDFRSFSDDDPDEKSTRVLVEGVEVAEAGALVLIRVVGSHFLWKMVRRLVGVIVEAGRGGLEVAEVRGFLDADSPTPARLTAPASGLFLERVMYEGDPGIPAISPAMPVGSAPRQ
ncbi:MAG: tRNA pseudouridine(38-40) synthase TruA [Vicinamibacterales bacterium]